MSREALDVAQMCFNSLFISGRVKFYLVGGWTNPFEKNARQIGSFPQKSVVKHKHHLSFHHLVTQFDPIGKFTPEKNDGYFARFWRYPMLGTSRWSLHWRNHIASFPNLQEPSRLVPLDGAVVVEQKTTFGGEEMVPIDKPQNQLFRCFVLKRKKKKPCTEYYFLFFFFF